ncbi:hypothetical protein Hanom_Chr02g00122421 [Helianthus anomalus]
MMHASLEKVTEMKMKKEETIDEKVEKVTEMMMKMKVTAEEAVRTEKIKVNTQTNSSESSNKDESMGNNDENGKQSEDKNDVQCRKCMKTCRACAEKDENLKSRDIEFTKIENVFKTKYKEMFENEEVLKQKVEKLTIKCQDFEKENEILKQNCLANCNECSHKDNIIQELQKEYDEMKFSRNNVKEAYETLKSQVKSMDGRLSKCLETTKLVEAKYKGKQLVLNQYIDKVAELKRELAEKEMTVNKLQSYHASSYILERTFNITPDEKILKRTKRVAKAMNMVDQLPDNIDATYSKSDDLGDSEVLGKVVESVLNENDSTNNGKSESQIEDEESFHKNYLKNSKSEKNANDDSIGLAYYMIGSDKLFSDVEFPTQNVIAEKVDKVFKLVEIEKAEIDKFVGKASKKTFYNKSGYKKKNKKVGLGYKKRHSQKKRSKKSNLPKKKEMNFVHKTSYEEEKEIRFSRQTNEEFYAQKKQQQDKDVSKKTCFKYQQIRHVGRKFPNLKHVNVEKEKVEAVKQKSTKFESKQTWKPKLKTPKFEPKQIWKAKVEVTKPKPTWKTKNIQV